MSESNASESTRSEIKIKQIIDLLSLIKPAFYPRTFLEKLLTLEIPENSQAKISWDDILKLSQLKEELETEKFKIISRILYSITSPADNNLFSSFTRITQAVFALETPTDKEHIELKIQRQASQIINKIENLYKFLTDILNFNDIETHDHYKELEMNAFILDNFDNREILSEILSVIKDIIIQTDSNSLRKELVYFYGEIVQYLNTIDNLSLFSDNSGYEELKNDFFQITNIHDPYLIIKRLLDFICNISNLLKFAYTALSESINLNSYMIGADADSDTQVQLKQLQKYFQQFKKLHQNELANLCDRHFSKHFFQTYNLFKDIQLFLANYRKSIKNLDCLKALDMAIELFNENPGEYSAAILHAIEALKQIQTGLTNIDKKNSNLFSNFISSKFKRSTSQPDKLLSELEQIINSYTTELGLTIETEITLSPSASN